MMRRITNDSANNGTTVQHATSKKRAIRVSRRLVWVLLSLYHGSRCKPVRAFSSTLSKLSTPRLKPFHSRSIIKSTAPPIQFDRSFPPCPERPTDHEQPPIPFTNQTNSHPPSPPPAPLARRGHNLLLLAPTGTGKTLAYLLPALSRPHGTLLLAPTRELAAQLARDASLLLDSHRSVVLAVRGLPPPTPAQLSHASVLVGTPEELCAVLTRVRGGMRFLEGGRLSTVILDEVDVLLPPPPVKTARGAEEQRRKVRAARRRGVEFRSGEGDEVEGVLTPTERILRLVASVRGVGREEGGERRELQLLAGSATASRATLERLNRALRWASLEGGVIGMGEGMDAVWRGNVQICRADDRGRRVEGKGESLAVASSGERTHTIRAVTVPSVVDHRYVVLSKESMANARDILENVARVSRRLQPETALIFICGEFSRTIAKEKKKEMPSVKGKTSQARRDAMRRRLFVERLKEETKQNYNSGLPEPLSVRSACSILQSLGMEAQPMHVALGLEPNACEHMDAALEEDDYREVELPPVLVTFEGSARGLHFDGVDVVFVVGRPTSAASYLHLAGRVGRSIPNRDADRNSTKVEVRPGVIVSFCSKGRVAELEKWTRQVGGTELKEIT